jgi:hypothetical protein
MASSTAADGGLDDQGCLPDNDPGESNADARRRIYRYPASDVPQRPTVSTSKSSALLETSLTDVVETYDHDLVPTGSNGFDDFDRRPIAQQVYPSFGIVWQIGSNHLSGRAWLS